MERLSHKFSVAPVSSHFHCSQHTYSNGCNDARRVNPMSYQGDANTHLLGIHRDGAVAWQLRQVVSVLADCTLFLPGLNLVLVIGAVMRLNGPVSGREIS